MFSFSLSSSMWAPSVAACRVSSHCSGGAGAGGGTSMPSVVSASDAGSISLPERRCLATSAMDCSIHEGNDAALASLEKGVEALNSCTISLSSCASCFWCAASSCSCCAVEAWAASSSFLEASRRRSLLVMTPRRPFRRSPTARRSCIARFRVAISSSSFCRKDGVPPASARHARAVIAAWSCALSRCGCATAPCSGIWAIGAAATPGGSAAAAAGV